MLRMLVVRSAIAAALFHPAAAVGGELTLDYPGALALAAARGPAVIAARGEVAEARGGRAGAAVHLGSNPELEVAAGPRSGGSTDVELGFSQGFELGGRRGARIAAADAAIAQAAAGADDTARLLRREVGLRFWRGVAGGERLRLAERAETVAGEIAAATERRLARGEAVELDVSLARAALGRAHAAALAAAAEQELAVGELAALLGVEGGDTLRLDGDLRARRTGGRELDPLLAAARRRPDLGRLDAERAEGAALVRVGDGEAWPELRLGVRYAREEGADLLLGGLSLTLPIFVRGQEASQRGRARIAGAGAHQEALARAVEAEVRAAFAVEQRRAAAAEAFEAEVLPRLDEADRLLARSYEAGAITLADYLVARRELLDARAEEIDRLLELAEASVELDAAAGVLP